MGLFSRTASFERDRPYNSQAEHLGSLFGRIRYQSWLLGLAWGTTLLFGYLLYRTATASTVHIYEVQPDGQASYVGSRLAVEAPPSDKEVLHVARRFAGLIYDYNSSKIGEMLEAAANMCAPSLREDFIKRTADTQALSKIQQQKIRTELEWRRIEVASQTDQTWTVLVAGVRRFFPIQVQTSAPLATEAFAVSLVLERVGRDPISFPNGLWVVAMHQPDPATLAKLEKEKT